MATTKTGARPRKPRGREKAADRAARAVRIAKGLRKLYNDADCALVHHNALELAVATILSAQCTDARVNQVTPALFLDYPTAQDYADAELEVIEQAIHSTGFFRNKARSIVGLGQALVEHHGGEVPDTMEQLVKLPGIGRKTANVILGTWFGKPAIPVDTHVTRLSNLMGLTKSKDPVKIERELQEMLPPKLWTFFSHAMIWHGRKVCIARRPACERCELSKECPSSTA